MTKKRTRENVYIMLFQTNFYQEEDRMEQADLYLEGLEDSDATNKAKSVIRERYLAVLEHLEEIDKKIEEKALGAFPYSKIGSYYYASGSF